MKNLRIAVMGVLASLVLAASAFAQQGPPVPSYSQDPCYYSAFKQSFTKSISTATTTALITVNAPTTGTCQIYLCNVQIAHPGGTGTMALEYGTGSTCGTGTTLIRAAFAYNTTAGTPTLDNMWGGDTTGYGMPAANNLCALSTGTIVQVVSGTYVQLCSM